LIAQNAGWAAAQAVRAELVRKYDAAVAAHTAIVDTRAIFDAIVAPSPNDADAKAAKLIADWATYNAHNTALTNLRAAWVNNMRVALIDSMKDIVGIEVAYANVQGMSDAEVRGLVEDILENKEMKDSTQYTIKGDLVTMISDYNFSAEEEYKLNDGMFIFEVGSGNALDGATLKNGVISIVDEVKTDFVGFVVIISKNFK